MKQKAWTGRTGARPTCAISPLPTIATGFYRWREAGIWDATSPLSNGWPTPRGGLAAVERP
jgi:hypothetical protein